MIQIGESIQLGSSVSLQSHFLLGKEASLWYTLAVALVCWQPLPARGRETCDLRARQLLSYRGNTPVKGAAVCCWLPNSASGEGCQQHPPQHSGLQDFPNLVKAAQNESQCQVRLFQFPNPHLPAQPFLVIGFCSSPLRTDLSLVPSSMHFWPHTQFLYQSNNSMNQSKFLRSWVKIRGTSPENMLFKLLWMGNKLLQHKWFKTTTTYYLSWSLWVRSLDSGQ